MQYATHHKIKAAGLAGLAITAMSLSGYAYAQGTDPISLVSRWVTGDKVQIKYEGRTFEHGAGRSYSDAAISAFAELGTVRDLHFKASNAFTIPKNGVEHVSNMSTVQFQYPIIGTVERVDKTNIYVRSQYILGDKGHSSSNDNRLITIPHATLSLYIKGEPAQANDQLVGKLVTTFQDPYLRHRTGDRAAPSAITQSFVFELSHPLAAIQEADDVNRESYAQRGANPGLQESATKPELYKPSWGSLSDVCLNNGADRCDTGKLAGEAGQGLYAAWQPDIARPTTTSDIKILGTKHLQSLNNPNVVPFGEMVLDPTRQDAGLILRNVEGKITKIQGDVVTIKASSGALWTLKLKSGLVNEFTQNWKAPLKVGDRLGGSIIGSIYDLDNRTADNRHIYDLKRY